jgi:hypothetical protein
MPTRPPGARWRKYWRALKGDGCTAVPDLGFSACCDNHDRHYATRRHRNGKRISRVAADVALLRCMFRNRKVSVIKRLLLAPVFFAGVRLFGWMHWRKSTPLDK